MTKNYHFFQKGLVTYQFSSKFDKDYEFLCPMKFCPPWAHPLGGGKGGQNLENPENQENMACDTSIQFKIEQGLQIFGYHENFAPPGLPTGGSYPRVKKILFVINFWKNF
jgi:hypothetical protein